MTFVLAACAPREYVQQAAPSEVATIIPIYVATEHSLDNLGPIFGQERPGELNFLRADVSIPPTHEPGNIEWPDGEPDAATDFVVTKFDIFKNDSAMISEMNRAKAHQETLVYIHGYNTTFSDALYRFAQIRYDFDGPGAGLVYSWASAGDARGYAYDRDSVLYARNDFERVLNALAQKTQGDIVLLAHSMGSQLVMETLRQAALKGNRQMLNRISAVALMSPDIDPDVFRRQAETIGKLPDPFVIFASQQDRALSFSSLLTGRKERLGKIDDPEELEGLNVRLIDFTGLGEDSGLNHSIPVTSPAAISVLKGMIEQSRRGTPAFKNYMALGDS